MIGTIMRKELTEHRRDGRARALLGLMGILVSVALITGWAAQTERQQQADQSQRDDQTTFLRQGDKPPHSAAHFGRIAYKPVAALAAFDPGASPYLGQAIWLEAHRQDPAMFRPAEDAPELRRLSDLSVAGILTMLLPLLIFLLGHSAFVGERERGNLSHILCNGPTRQHLLLGKLLAITTIGVGVSSLVVATSTAMAALGDSTNPSSDTLIRGVGLAAAYAVYCVILGAVALGVSARARNSSSALLILLSVWAIATVILPRVAAGVADRLHPTPEGAAFWKQTSDAIRSTKPRRDSAEYRAAERTVLSRVFGRDLGTDEAAAIQLDRRGLNLEISEMLGARAYSAAYEDLYATYEKQRRIRRWLALLAPAISLQHFSSAVAGTDIDAHRHFSSAAERQRQAIISMMNQDLMMHGGQAGDSYLSGRNLWRQIPNFGYRHPSAASAIRFALWDGAVLVLCSIGALLLAWHGVNRQRIV